MNASILFYRYTLKSSLYHPMKGILYFCHCLDKIILDQRVNFFLTCASFLFSSVHCVIGQVSLSEKFESMDSAGLFTSKVNTTNLCKITYQVTFIRYVSIQAKLHGFNQKVLQLKPKPQCVSNDRLYQNIVSHLIELAMKRLVLFVIKC